MHFNNYVCSKTSKNVILQLHFKADSNPINNFNENNTTLELTLLTHTKEK